MKREQAIAEIRAVERRCRGPLAPDSRKVVNALLDERRLEDAKRADAAGRPGCGFDFNTIVVAGPFDGERHPYTCPDCGVSGFYTAPKYELED